ncbi:unconventional myosin-XVIIIa isoform X4 [Homalodisca vitripennis]|uniref:unconventional myosin-XVIIIa isoform X4 n=1 Tax=Homalodisca vitripennis TaxID=197043 RepID=UPI001EEA5AB0|nr:unconventional myosin-XVIIIa isoform X4 [Homalodisca vitripennis]
MDGRAPREWSWDHLLSVRPCVRFTPRLGSMFTSDYSSHLQRLFQNVNVPQSGVEDSTPLTAHRLRNAFRSASVAEEPRRADSASRTVWKYKPIALRRLSMASRSPSCCSTASEAESITESFNSGKIELQRSETYNPNVARSRGRGSSTFINNSSFVMGMRRQPLQRASGVGAGRRELETTSAQLSARISEFLQRTDHVMDEWKRLGHREPLDVNSLKRSSSVSNIMIRGFQYWGRESSTNKSLCTSSCDVLSETDELSELTMDLAEEHSSATLANQRLKIESAEKMRLEKELDEIQKERKQLQESSDRLEMELLYSQGHSGAVNGSELDVDLEGDEDTAYKQRYERAVRELEFTRRRLQQQHQDDLEQLIALKKQLEKKLSDAYEEVEEQRQVVGQWKKKVQKLTSEMNDLRLLLERQTSRNDMLEKKQRKFDTEIQLLTDELRQEKANKDRSMREKEMALADKYTMEQNLSAVKLELELKEQKVNSLTSEINELTFGGNTEEEIGQLKKAKHQLTNKLKEQEEELDDLAGQVQLLETAKLRLEMSLEQVRKENKKELAQRDEELEEVRCNVQKKVRALECQLENEHEERTLLLRERHEMERRLAEYEERNHSRNHSDQEMLNRLKRDLKRTKALLRDAQTTIEQSRTDTPNKALIRQLRNQLEDAECARAVAVKARQAAEGERTEALATLEDATRARTEAEERASALMRERSQLQSQLDENEEELADVLKKYRATVQQLSHEQMSLQEQAGRVAELEAERATLREQLAELSTRVESMETLNDPNSSLAVKRLQLKTKELESKLELEQTTRSRLEVQITRLKENNERLQSDIEIVKSREHSAQEKAKTSSRQVRELREENAMLASKEHEAQAKIRELDKSVETAEADAAAARSDLRLALQRIEDLQCAIQGDMEDADDNSGASSDSDSSIRSDEIMNSCAGSRSHHLTDSGESSYQSMDRSSSQLRKLEPFTKDSSVA